MPSPPHTHTHTYTHTHARTHTHTHTHTHTTHHTHTHTIKRSNSLARLSTHPPTRAHLARLYISFFSPTLVYAPGSNTLVNAGLGLDTSGDYGFAKLKA
jgi:hypothetical protein